MNPADLVAQHWPAASPPGDSWRDSAACAGEPLDVFYGPTTARALSICAQCPVTTACLTAAFFEERHAASVDGVRGGTTPDVRRAWLAGRALPTSRPKVARCDTESGYKRHRRQGEEPCAACKGAHSRYESDRRARSTGRHSPVSTLDAGSRRSA